MTNPDIVTILRQRIDQCRCLGAVPATRCCGGCEHDTRCLVEIVEVRRERDKARRVLRKVVEEFVHHGRPSHPSHQPTPPHGCEFKYDPYCDKCDACKTWSDYVRICHLLEKTDEEETP
jgi:hypothetical protein